MGKLLVWGHCRNPCSVQVWEGLGSVDIQCWLCIEEKSPVQWGQRLQEAPKGKPATGKQLEGGRKGITGVSSFFLSFLSCQWHWDTSQEKKEMEKDMHWDFFFLQAFSSFHKSQNCFCCLQLRFSNAVVSGLPAGETQKGVAPLPQATSAAWALFPRQEHFWLSHSQ